MLESLLEKICCPKCGSKFDLAISTRKGTQIESGQLICSDCKKKYPIDGGIPRFVPSENYGETFGRQWQRFYKQQLDSLSGTTLSFDRFYEVTHWKEEDLKGLWILDVGCGAGRFTEIALRAGANVVAMDISSAVNVCYRTLSERFPDTLHVVQGNIYEFPFPPGSFDRSYCIGVIQHTPDPHESIRAIARMPRVGGEMAIWVYKRRWQSLLGIYAWKYCLRSLTSRWSYENNYLLSWILTVVLWPLWFPMLYLGFPGRAVLFWLPVAGKPYAGKNFGLRQVFECVLMDTLDMYSPAYDIPQTDEEVIDVLRCSGCDDIRQTCVGAFTARCPSQQIS